MTPENGGNPAEAEAVDSAPAESNTKQDLQRWLRQRVSLPVWVLIFVVLVGLALGAGVGASGGIQKSEYDEVSTELEDAHQKIADLKGEVASARAEARGAERQARQKLEAEFESKNDALDTREASLAAREQQLTALEEAKKKDEIEEPGIYEVGIDINAGKWKTDGGSGTCYYAKLRTSDTSDIIDNNNVDGPAVVTLAAGQYFEVGRRCGPWQRSG